MKIQTWLPILLAILAAGYFFWPKHHERDTQRIAGADVQVVEPKVLDLRGAVEVPPPPPPMPTINVGGTELNIPTPDGFLAPGPESKRFSDLQKDVMTTSGSRACAFYIDAQEIDKTKTPAGTPIPGLNRYIAIQVVKSTEGLKVPLNDFKQLKTVLRQNMAEKIKEIEKDFPGILDAASAKVKKREGLSLAVQIHKAIALPPHDETDQSLSFSLYVAMSGDDGTGNTVSRMTIQTVSCLLLREKVVFIYIHGLADDLDWSRATAKTCNAQILSANTASGITSPK